MIDRRRFLTGAAAVVTAPLAVWLGAELAPGAGHRHITRLEPIAAGAPDADQLPPAYAYGAPTSVLLARTGPYLVAPAGTFTTPYQDAAPLDGKTWDMRGARFQGYYDVDAYYQTDEFAGGSTEQQKNTHPVNLGYAMPMGGAAVIGGIVEGTQPTTLTWERMKYGQAIQDDTDRWIDAGRPASLDPHRAQVGNRNQDGDPRMYIKAGTWAVWDGVQVRNSHDGIGLYRGPGEGSGTCYIRNCWLQGNRDDAIENDDRQELHVLDTLVEGTYTFVSSQSDAGADAEAGRAITVEDSVVRLQPFPGGFETRSTDAVHGSIYKSRPDSPALRLRNVVIASERFRDPPGVAPLLPTRQGAIEDRYENVTLVWLGQGRTRGTSLPAAR